MKQKKDWIKAREELRAEADQAFSRQPLAGMMAKPAETMLHELLVHKFELETQIEELKRPMPNWRRRGIVISSTTSTRRLAISRLTGKAESPKAT